MAIELPNGKISRTLPEQVGFNSAKIEEIIKFLNESGLKDLVISVDAVSGTLTPEQLAIAELSPSYVLYGGKVYVKALEDLTNIDYFQVGVNISGSAEYQASVERIRVVRDTRAYAAETVNLFESYTSDQIDTLLAAKANLSGANFTGEITSPSIIEIMEGYSFVKNADPTNYEISIKYAGISKTGNKLTVAVFFSIIKRAGAGSSSDVWYFKIPKSVADKLIPYTQSGVSSILSTATFTAFSNVYTSVNCSSLIQKLVISSADCRLLYTLYGLVNLTADSEYTARIETTFLLSDNLAQ